MRLKIVNFNNVYTKKNKKNICDNLFSFRCVSVCVTVCVYKVQCCSWPSIHPITPALALFLSAVNQGSKEWGETRAREGEEEKERGKEKGVVKGGGVVSMDRWTALSQHMWNHVSSFTAVKLEPNPSLCWPAPLFRTAHLSLKHNTHTHTHTCKCVHAERHTQKTHARTHHTNISVFLCTHVKVITPAQR